MPTLTDDFKTKLDTLCKRIEAEHHATWSSTLIQIGQRAGLRTYEECHADAPGPRFVRIFWKGVQQNHSHLWVEIETGIIFGSSGWKKYNPVHQYGTLDTLDEWDWSGYYPKHKEGKLSLVPKHLRR